MPEHKRNSSRNTTILMALRSLIILSFLLTSLFVYTQECDSTVYEVVEVMPEFPGGIEEMYKYLMDVSLPKLDNDNQIIGSFFFTFIVECDGNISNVIPVKYADHPYTIVMKEHIEQMPIWIPGKHHQSPVNVKYSLPIHITIDID